jgi:4-alpha-glucanotransferase
VNLPRSAGIQLHLTSLPEGRLGPSAYAFVDWMAEAGLSWWQMLPVGPPDRYGSPYKAASAFAAWRGFLAEPSAPVDDDEVESFVERHAFWAPGWADFAGGRRALADQVRFEREWSALRAHAADRGVKLFGDVPIYVAPGGADQATWPELFIDGAVAGAPPDKLGPKGQLWGNPLYDWPAMRRRRYRWWVERARRTFELFDLARIDHFRAFVSYWAVPEGAADASAGGWRRGPGRAPFDAIAAELGQLQWVAEDLGVITPPVTELRQSLGLPGMAVLIFGFDPDDPDGPHRPENITEDRVAYTTTHDTDTVRGFLDTASDPVRAELLTAGVRDHWDLLRVAWESPAPLAMTSAQDVLGLGSEHRMNVPGRASGSWRWKLEPGQLTSREARRLRALTEDAGRLVS